MNELIAALWRDETPHLLGAAIVLVALLFRFLATGRVTSSIRCCSSPWLLLDVVAAIFAARYEVAIAAALHQAALLGFGLVLIRLSGLVVFRDTAAGAQGADAAHPRGHRRHRRLRAVGNGAAVPRRRRTVQPGRHLGGDHCRARLRDAGYARQHPRRPRAAARQLAGDRRLGQARRRFRARGRDPVALHRDSHAQWREGRGAERPA